MLDVWLRDLSARLDSLLPQERELVLDFVHLPSGVDNALPSFRKTTGKRNRPVYELESGMIGSSGSGERFPGTLFQGALGCTSLKLKSQGAGMSGVFGGDSSSTMPVYLLLSHLSINVFRQLGKSSSSIRAAIELNLGAALLGGLSSRPGDADGDAVRGELIASLALNDLLSIHKGAPNGGLFVFLIQDTEYGSARFTSSSEEEINSWIQSISSAHNRFLHVATSRLDRLSSGHFPDLISLRFSDTQSLGNEEWYNWSLLRPQLWEHSLNLPGSVGAARIEGMELRVHFSHGVLLLNGTELEDLCDSNTQTIAAAVGYESEEEEDISSLRRRDGASWRMVEPNEPPGLQSGFVLVIALVVTRNVADLATESFISSGSRDHAQRLPTSGSTTRSSGLKVDASHALAIWVGALFVAVQTSMELGQWAAILWTLYVGAAVICLVTKSTLSINLPVGISVKPTGNGRQLSQNHTFTIQFIDHQWLHEDDPRLSGIVDRHERPEAKANDEFETGSLSAQGFVVGVTSSSEASLPLPERFVKGCSGNLAMARQAWEKTVAWRQENDIKNILNCPQPHFETIKGLFENYFCGVDRLGHPVEVLVLNSPASTFKNLASRGITTDAVVAHQTFVHEFMWKEHFCDDDVPGVCPNPCASTLKIVDVQAVGLGDVGGLVADYFKKMQVLNRNYPERMYKTFLVNVPAHFSFVWRLVEPLLEPEVRSKIFLYRGDTYREALLELVDPVQLPEKYGGSIGASFSERPGGDLDQPWLLYSLEKELHDAATAAMQNRGTSLA